MPESISGVDTRRLIRRIRSEDNVRAPREHRFGLSYPVDTNGQTHSVSVGVFADPEAARSAFNEMESRSQASPADKNLEIGDEDVFWPPPGPVDPEGGAILFRRWNVVVYSAGALDVSQREGLARELDSALVSQDDPVSGGTPLVPEVRLLTPTLAFSEDEENIGTIPVEVDNFEPGELFLYTPDEETARIHARRGTPVDPPLRARFQFYQHPRGRRRHTIVAVTARCVVGTLTFSIEIV